MVRPAYCRFDTCMIWTKPECASVGVYTPSNAVNDKGHAEVSVNDLGALGDIRRSCPVRRRQQSGLSQPDHPA
jgi:hypothetical protein